MATSDEIRAAMAVTTAFFGNSADVAADTAVSASHELSDGYSGLSRGLLNVIQALLTLRQVEQDASFDGTLQLIGPLLTKDV